MGLCAHEENITTWQIAGGWCNYYAMKTTHPSYWSYNNEYNGSSSSGILAIIKLNVSCKSLSPVIYGNIVIIYNIMLY